VKKTLFVFIACGLIILGLTWMAADADRSSSAAGANAELEQMFRADQADRTPADKKPIDWSIVGPRDLQRRKRVLEMYRAGDLKAGSDFFHAGMILQHGHEPEDFLLCHELCVTAVFCHSEEKGGWLAGAKWLAAASEDRFLQSIGRKQRFGTQYRTLDPDPTWRLGDIEEGVTDEMRKAWNTPSLAQARSRLAEMNRR
jgi:hypothetical protein